MSKPGIETQVEKWLEGRGRWLRSGGDHLVRYLSVMLGNGDQVDELFALLTAEELPDWLYVERDGRRVTQIGLTKWANQAVEYDEVSDDAWAIVGAQHVELAALRRQLAEAHDKLAEHDQLFAELTDPAAVAVPLETVEIAVSPECDHAALEAELRTARQRAAAFESANANKQTVITKLQADLKVARTAERSARRAMKKLANEVNHLMVEYLTLIRTATFSRSDSVLSRMGREHLAACVRLFARLTGSMPEESRQQLKQLERQLSA